MAPQSEEGETREPRPFLPVVGIGLAVLVASVAIVWFLFTGIFSFGHMPLPDDREMKQLFNREYQVFEELRTLVAQYEGHVVVSDRRTWGAGITKEKAEAIRASLSQIGALGIEKREGRNGLLEVGFRIAGLHGGAWGSSMWIEYHQAVPSPVVEETDPPEPQEYGSARYVALNRDGWYIVRKW